jgi:hypothetical protein
MSNKRRAPHRASNAPETCVRSVVSEGLHAKHRAYRYWAGERRRGTERRRAGPQPWGWPQTVTGRRQTKTRRWPPGSEAKD